MPRTRPPYPDKFRKCVVELARNGRKPSELAEEFEPSQTTIRNWIKQAVRDDGKSAEGLSTDERETIGARATEIHSEPINSTLQLA